MKISKICLQHWQKRSKEMNFKYFVCFLCIAFGLRFCINFLNIYRKLIKRTVPWYTANQLNLPTIWNTHKNKALKAPKSTNGFYSTNPARVSTFSRSMCSLPCATSVLLLGLEKYRQKMFPKSTTLLSITVRCMTKKNRKVKTSVENTWIS